MKRIIGKEIPRPIGRWRIEMRNAPIKCNKKIDNKIDLSNEDHCGPCGQYALDKIAFLEKPKINSYNKVAFEMKKI